MKLANNQRGFTLIEILIAITLFSVLMVTVFTITNNSADTKDRITGEDQDFVQVQMTLSRIGQDFKYLYNPLFFTYIDTATSTKESGQEPQENNSSTTYQATERFPIQTTGKIPVPIITDDGSEKEIGFLTANNKRILEDIKQSNYSWVYYKLQPTTLPEEEQREGAGFDLVRLHAPSDVYAPDFNWDEITPQIMLRHVKEIKFSYWKKKDEKWVSPLRSLGEEVPHIRVLRMQLTWVDREGIEQKHLKTYRVLYPFFDTQKDQEEIKKAKAPKKETSKDDQENKEI